MDSTEGSELKAQGGSKVKVAKVSVTGGVSKITSRDCLGGSVDRNPPANAGDTGSVSGVGRSHMP